MADGHIKIKISVDGKDVEVASQDLTELGSAGHKAGDGARGAGDGLREVGAESKKSTGSIKKFAAGLGLVAIGAAAFKTLRSSMDAAISRFDTLNNFPKVLQSLGVSAEDAEKSINDLSDGIDGLPTKLDDIAGNAQRMYTSFADMDKATDSAIALNNALLGSGASSADAQRGADQYIKVLQTGKMELDTWNTLSETMDVALVKVADSFGYTGRSAKQDLYKALQDGSITIDDFNDKLIELGTGTGELAELARVNSMGMATSLANLKTAASRGIADILQSFNKLSKDATGKEVAEHIDSLKVIINKAFKAIGKAIESATPIVKGFISVIKGIAPVVKVLTPSLLAMVAAYKAYNVIEKSNALLKTAMAVKGSLTLVTKGQIAAQMTSTGATKADTLATVAQTGAVKLSTLAMGVMTGTISLSAAAKTVAAAASYALGAALKFMMGPIGWVTAGIGLLVVGITAAVKWFKRETAEAKRLKAETEELAEATDGLVDSVEQSSKAYEDSQKDMKATARQNKTLAKEIEELAKKENKSAADKMLLQSKIDLLNESVEGLNLSYSEQADALNMSNEQLKGRVELTSEQASYNSALERQVEIERERNKVELQIQEVIEKRKEWNEALEEGTIKSREHKKHIEELEEQSSALGETHAQLTADYKQATEEVALASENMVTAIEENNLRQEISYETLEGAQKEAFDNMMSSYQELEEAAIDAFEKINTETDHTMKSMIETLRHNQEVVEEWGENQAKLMDWAGENGYDNFLPYIESMGIDSAAELAVLANASETELTEFADAIEAGAETAGKGFKTALGNEFDDVVDEVIDFVDHSSRTMREEIEAANFPDIGESLPDGVVAGIEKGKTKVSNTSAEMAREAAQATRKEAKISSPSKVFTEIGENMTEGLTLGVSNGTSKVTESMQNVAKLSTQQFSGFRSSFRTIGSNAMGGLNAGLEAGRNRVMATARGIANQVASTMQSALRISSPSKVMEQDVGRWIPAGLVEGIEKNAPSVYKAMHNMSVAMSTPERALNTPRMAFVGAGGTSHSASNKVSHSGTIRVEGVNNNNELVSVVDIVLDELRKESRT